MFARSRQRALALESLEGRFAPSSVLIGAGGRSTLRDAQAVETTQAEQAAFFMAASAVMSQSASATKVEPIAIDQSAASNSAGESDWDGSGFCGYIDPGTIILVSSGEWNLDGETIRHEMLQPAGGDDAGPTPDVPSVDPISPETPSEPSNDADPVGAVPSEELPAGGDDVAAEDFPPVVDDTLVAGDEVADPVGEDTGVSDASDTEELPRCGNGCEDSGPSYPINTDSEFANADGADEIAVDEVPVEWHSGDAADEAAPFDA